MRNADKELSDFASDDVFDSRDMQARIDELESDIEDRESDDTSIGAELDADALELMREELEAMKDELAALIEFRDEVEGYASDKFRDGITFIADDYFETYAEEYADDIGAIDRNASWPLSHIDWTAAADELKVDYTSVELDGNTFWYR